MLHKILTKILLEVKDKYGYTIRRFGLFKNTYAFFRNIVASKVVVSKINGVGARMLLDLNDIYMAARIYVNDYELVETKLFKSLLKPGMNVVDVGAAIGYYTCIAGKLLGPEGKVYAFEPAPRNFSILRKNIELNNLSNVILYQKAVANFSGEVSLSSMNFGDNRIVDHPEERETVSVES